MSVIQPVSIRVGSRKSLGHPCLLDIYAVKGAGDQESGGVYDNLDDRAIIIHSSRLY